MCVVKKDRNQNIIVTPKDSWIYSEISNDIIKENKDFAEFLYFYWETYLASCSSCDVKLYLNYDKYILFTDFQKQRSNFSQCFSKHTIKNN